MILMVNQEKDLLETVLGQISGSLPKVRRDGRNLPDCCLLFVGFGGLGEPCVPTVISRTSCCTFLNRLTPLSNDGTFSVEMRDHHSVEK